MTSFSVPEADRTIAAAGQNAAFILAPTATITISGSAISLPVTANGKAGGPYPVMASTRGGNLVTFTLTNSLKLTPTLTVTSSLNPSTVGQAVTFTATASATGSSPTGSLSFVIDGIAQPPVNLVAGQATFFTTTLSIGLHSVGATYSGDANFYSTSGSLPGGQLVKTKVISPTVQFSQTLYLVTEGQSQALVLSRSGDLSSGSQVRVSLKGGQPVGEQIIR